MEYKPVTHVLFDMDGLILDTEDLYTRAFQNILDKYDKTYTFEFKMWLMGQQSNETAQAVVKQYGLPMTPEQFQEACKEQFTYMFPEAKLLPGVKRLIEHLYNQKVPLGLATSSSEEYYKMKVDKNHKEFFRMFSFKTFGSKSGIVRRGKPHPDIFLVAASRFPECPDPETCLVFEDSINGVRAARAAGMQVVMVPDKRLDRDYTRDATLVLDSLEDFKPELFGLPPFEE